MEMDDFTTLPISSPDIVAIFRDLAHLSLHAGTANQTTPEKTSSAVLERVAATCHATRGGIIILSDKHERITEQTFLEEGTTQLLATYHTDATQIQKLLALASVGGYHSDPVLDFIYWITYEIPVVQNQNMLFPENFHIWLVLGWSNREDIERYRKLLDLLAEAIGAVIMGILQQEYIHVLQKTAEIKTNQLKGELLGTVSHELRSPLTTIKGYTDTLLRHDRRISREERREFLLAVADASSRLEVMINRILELSELEAGTFRMEHLPVNITQVVQESLQSAEQDLGPLTKRYSFLFIPPAHRNFMPLVWGDARRLRTIFDHVIENAIKYSPQGGNIEIEMRYIVPDLTIDESDILNEHQIQQGTMLEVIVRDSGVGIKDEHLERIFDRFFRIDNTLARESEGLGIGLAICKRLVELHGGTIWGESITNRGSAFHVLLPVEVTNFQEG